MEEQFILRVPPSVAEQIERLMNESAAGSSSNPEDASLDLSFSGAPVSSAFREFYFLFSREIVVRPVGLRV
jgi:transcription initiation factor TFIID subunit 7